MSPVETAATRGPSSTAWPPPASIPPSWARPAEEVAGDKSRGAGRAPWLLLVALLGLFVLVAAPQLTALRTGPSPRSLLPTPAPVPLAEVPPPAPVETIIAAAAPPPIASAPEPVLQRTAALAPEDDDAVPGDPVAVKPNTGPPRDEAAHRRAGVLLRAAQRAAKAGDSEKARAFAEDAVDKDPRCGECWGTVAFLRRQSGDLEGSRAARRQARLLAP